MDTLKTPIVLTAFGTTAKAMDTYDYMDKIIRERFSNHIRGGSYWRRRRFMEKKETLRKIIGIGDQGSGGRAF